VYVRPVQRRFTPLLWIVGIAGVIWLLVPHGYPNYDTLYALLWGGQLAHGMSPGYGTDPPTPHPLADLWGAVTDPLGAVGAADATNVLAYLTLGTIAYLVYRLGSDWFDRPIGVLAGAIVLTRVPFISNGLRAFADLPYLALVLAALLVETRRPRAGWPVLGLLALAGLIRPEAWLFSAAYLVYLLFEPDPGRESLRFRLRRGLDNRELAGLVALAAAAPLLWACFDLITTGEPLYSLTATQSRVESLGRHTGLLELVTYGPGQLDDVLQWPGAFGAAAGLVLGFVFLRPRAILGVVVVLLAGLAFALLAASGLAIISRYLLLGGALLSIFCALAMLGWRLLPPNHDWRRRWQLIALAIAVLFIVQAPQQYRFLSDASQVLADQRKIGSDLHGLADSGAFAPGCRPIVVPGVQAVPRLAAWLDLDPSTILVAGEQRQPSRGYFLHPASPDAALHYGTAPVPSGFRPAARNDSWLLYARCS
jgi:hypothetical protein